jgi:hypothetical protein
MHFKMIKLYKQNANLFIIVFLQNFINLVKLKHGIPTGPCKGWKFKRAILPGIY